ncbi:MAG: DNA translocase FtsK 4TM domain-containing protein [Candidatus Vogelbacteria bacterium]|nr:DNA translocase FtsK 4TM domain-containing protein [Candidatus Vogelbacteria bacterium]
MFKLKAKRGRPPKNHSNNIETKPGLLSAIKGETKRGVLAISALALAIFLLLAHFNKGGSIGGIVSNWTSWLLGTGFFLLPIILILFGLSLLRTERRNLLRLQILGGILLFLASLSLASISSQMGGALGNTISTPLIELFGLAGTIVFLGAMMVVASMFLFDTHLTLDRKLFGWNLSGRIDKEVEDKGELEETEDETPVLVPPMSPIQETPRETPISTGPNLNDSKAFSLSSLMTASKRGGKIFTPPPLSLLEKDSGKPVVGDIKAQSTIIKRTLANFGITVEMDEISIGPSVTRFALKPAEGTKVARILSLQNDLALALAAHPIRIEAPIPGKSLVGIEIPNNVKTTVGLGTLLGMSDFTGSAHPLLFSLGKSIDGLPQFANLAKAPHLMIAGTTGSGKSVAVHTIITSLLYRNPPERLRFIMIDPKRVELTMYNKIPHLLTPVITDAKKAIASLRWAAKEMDRRYDLLEGAAVRDIQSYHKNMVEPALTSSKVTNEETADEIELMPYIVIVIDELADIMSAYPRELEAAIVRLAQMSRAVGIHLILSTQRPSVEVITGLIKANIPSRIALQVASQIDSRTIIDMAGAEKLLGAGDMLFLSSDMGKPRRIQSAFISETEVKKVVQFLAERHQNDLPSVINLEPEGGGSNALFSTALDDDNDSDDLYEDAREAVITAGKASASYLQRKLKIGYARAARLLDMLEERGVIGPGEGAKARDVYGATPTATVPEEELI